MPDPSSSGRFTQAFPITPSDTVAVQGPNGNISTNAIHALTAGNVTALFQGDRAHGPVTFPVLAGVVYPYALSFVYTSSTATILGLL